MPRISRTAVEFEADGHRWLAEFSHKHALRSCPHTPAHAPKTCPAPTLQAIAWQPDATKPPIAVQHITTVRLRHKGRPAFMTGHAPCSLRDSYHWQRGIHLAMQRALEKAGYCTLAKPEHCPHIIEDAIGDVSQHSDATCPSVGRVIVVDKKPIYDEVMRAFWREMQIRGSSPAAAPSSAVIPPPQALSMLLECPVDLHRVYCGPVSGANWGAH